MCMYNDVDQTEIFKSYKILVKSIIESTENLKILKSPHNYSKLVNTYIARARFVKEP